MSRQHGCFFDCYVGRSAYILVSRLVPASHAMHRTASSIKGQRQQTEHQDQLNRRARNRFSPFVRKLYWRDKSRCLFFSFSRAPTFLSMLPSLAPTFYFSVVRILCNFFWRAFFDCISGRASANSTSTQHQHSRVELSPGALCSLSSLSCLFD
jgi:hypothetical protein